jgi:SAM-dependent methyltransferase
MAAYKKFEYITNYAYTSGWDQFALSYKELGKPRTIYQLTKNLMYDFIQSHLKAKIKQATVLDLNCGTGNDFNFFLQNGCKITGCDGSLGMLNIAHEKFSEKIKNGDIELYHGFLERLNFSSFGDKKFDVIYSITGGFSYVDDAQFKKIHEQLRDLLNPNGLLIVGHMNTFSLGEWMYNTLTRKKFPKRKKETPVVIKDEPFTLYLRKVTYVKSLTDEYFTLVATSPLLTITPPYQTGINRVGRLFYPLFYYFERCMQFFNIGKRIADQNAFIFKKKNT